MTISLQILHFAGACACVHLVMNLLSQLRFEERAEHKPNLYKRMNAAAAVCVTYELGAMHCHLYLLHSHSHMLGSLQAQQNARHQNNCIILQNNAFAWPFLTIIDNYTATMDYIFMFKQKYFSHRGNAHACTPPNTHTRTHKLLCTEICVQQVQAVILYI